MDLYPEKMSKIQKSKFSTSSFFVGALYFLRVGTAMKNSALESDSIVCFLSISCLPMASQLAACFGAGLGGAALGGPFASIASSLFLKSSGDGSGSGVVSGARAVSGKVSLVYSSLVVSFVVSAVYLAIELTGVVIDFRYLCGLFESCVLVRT